MGIKAVLSGQQKQFEHEYIRPIPHTIRWYRMTVRAWQQLGAGALIFHRDITAEKMGMPTSAIRGPGISPVGGFGSRHDLDVWTR